MTAEIIVFLGAPGSGKTTLSRRLAQEIGATYLRIDAIEKGIYAEFPDLDLKRSSYFCAVELAREALHIKQTVVADAVHAVECVRTPWVELAKENNVNLIWVYVACTDESVHAARIEDRRKKGQTHGADLAQIRSRAFDPVLFEHIFVDTSAAPENDSFSDMIRQLATRSENIDL